MIDPTLARLAAGLKYLIFDIDETEREDFRFTPKFSISIFPNSRTWRVRLFLAGKRCVVGTTDDGPTAARYADAARLFFWPYRARNAHPPVEADMNYSLEQAESDLENVDGLRAMLHGIVSHLQLELPDLEKPKKEDRRTVRSDFNVRFNAIEQQLLALAKIVQEGFHEAEKQRWQVRRCVCRIEHQLPPVTQDIVPVDELDIDNPPGLSDSEIEQENNNSKQPL